MTFEEFFAGEFQRQLHEVKIPPEAFATPPAGPIEYSWDRKAAWLLWCAGAQAPLPMPEYDPPSPADDYGY